MLSFIVTQTTRAEVAAMDPGLDNIGVVLLKDELVLLQKMRDGSLTDVVLSPMEARDDGGMLAECEMANLVDGAVVLKVNGDLYRATLPEPFVVQGHTAVAAAFSRTMMPFELTFGATSAGR